MDGKNGVRKYWTWEGVRQIGEQMPGIEEVELWQGGEWAHRLFGARCGNLEHEGQESGIV